MQLYAACTYDAVNVLADAMVRAGSPDPNPDQYLPEVSKAQWKGLTGLIAFDAKGDIKNVSSRCRRFVSEKKGTDRDRAMTRGGDDVDPKSLRIGSIGTGRLGAVLAWRLEAHGCNVHAASNRTPRRAIDMAKRTRACRVLSAQGVADACDLIFATTPDGLIESTVDGVACTHVVHCSGATEISALAKAAADGASTGGFYPMQAFGNPRAQRERCRGA